MDHNPEYAGGNDLEYFEHHGRHVHQHEPNSPWIESAGYHSQHTSPVTEYPHFAFGSPPPTIGPGPYYPSSIQPHTRPAHHQLQPLITPTWPSMLTSSPTSTQQHHSAPHHYHQHVLPPPPPQPTHPPSASSGPGSAPPQLSSHAHGPPASTPRRTLTDSDRRKMCLYHEEHPHKKQTEIGEIFGVERSTVSKVLRQKDKYLHQDDGSRSPIKKPKGKYPDIDRTLAKWVSNQQSKGVLVTDEHIRSQAKLFWIAAGNGSDSSVNFDSTQWLEKFKQKLKSSSLKSRGSGSITSPITPGGAHSTTISPIGAGGGIVESPVSARASTITPGMSYGLGIAASQSAPPRQPLHMQSNTSLSSAFTENAGTNTSMSSPMFSPEDGHPMQNSYFPSSTAATPVDMLGQHRLAYPHTTTTSMNDSIVTLSPESTLHGTPIDSKCYFSAAHTTQSSAPHNVRPTANSSLQESSAMDTDMPPPSSISAPASQTHFDPQQARRASMDATGTITEMPPMLAQAFRRSSPPPITTTSLPSSATSFYSTDTARSQPHSHSYPPRHPQSQLQSQKTPRSAISTPPMSTLSAHASSNPPTSTPSPSVDEARRGLEIALAFVKASRSRDAFAASVGVPTVQEDDESALVRILEKLGNKGPLHAQHSPHLQHINQHQLITPISAVSADLNAAAAVGTAMASSHNRTSAPDAAMTNSPARLISATGTTLHTIEEA